MRRSLRRHWFDMGEAGRSAVIYRTTSRLFICTMALIKSLSFVLFADYHQFYLQDEQCDSDWADAWTDEATSRMLAVAPGVVAVGTARNTHVPVLLELHDGEPEPDLDEWERVMECGLDVKSDRIVIAGCTDYFPSAARVEVAAGLYRVRVSYAGLSSLSEDGLSGDDRYRVQLWLGQACAPRRLK